MPDTRVDARVQPESQKFLKIDYLLICEQIWWLFIVPSPDKATGAAKTHKIIEGGCALAMLTVCIDLYIQGCREPVPPACGNF